MTVKKLLVSLFSLSLVMSLALAGCKQPSSDKPEAKDHPKEEKKAEDEAKKDHPEEKK